jgi:hypothetical protein
MNTDNLWLAISILVLAVFAAIWTLKRIKRHRAHTWPIGEGRVISTNIRRVGSGSQQAHLAEVTYSYALNGQTYSGVSSRRFMLYGSAGKWLAKFESGRSLIVRVNPKNPRESLFFEMEQAQSNTSVLQRF